MRRGGVSDIIYRMTMIEARGVEKFHGGRPVLRGLEMKVGPGARIGLIGGNGAGKSTLLRLLADLDDVDAGEIVRRRGLCVAFLPQHVEGDERTPLEVVRAARPEISDLLGELRRASGISDLPRPQPTCAECSGY